MGRVKTDGERALKLMKRAADKTAKSPNRKLMREWEAKAKLTKSLLPEAKPKQREYTAEAPNTALTLPE